MNPMLDDQSSRHGKYRGERRVDGSLETIVRTRPEMQEGTTSVSTTILYKICIYTIQLSIYILVYTPA